LEGIRIAPSILGGDLANLRGSVQSVVDAGADLVHLDIIDGHFAPNITFGPGTVKALRPITDIPFDVHLMIADPAKYVDSFLNAGSDILSLHVEAIDEDTFDVLHSKAISQGKALGLALKPATPLPAWAERRLGKISTLLVLTVNPGFSGQTFDSSVLPKLALLHRTITDGRFTTDIEVDGGIDLDNVQSVVRRGANIIVAGAGVFGKGNVERAISELRDKASMVQVTK
jgi:ribulose-phosphate 3-epimerase